MQLTSVDPHQVQIIITTQKKLTKMSFFISTVCMPENGENNRINDAKLQLIKMTGAAA
jgi:hypothetical protein